MEKTVRRCTLCGCALRNGNNGELCSVCAKRKTAKVSINLRESYDQRYYDLEQIRELLGLDSYEQARRKAQHREIPGRVPGIWRYLYDKKTVDEWLKNSFDNGIPKRLPDGTAEALTKLGEMANNLERRLPLKQVIGSFESQYPLKEVAKDITQFIQEAPPPNEVIGDIINNLFKK